jgi:hypothetical protein
MIEEVPVVGKQLWSPVSRFLSRGVDGRYRLRSMRKHYLSLLSLLFAAFILLGGRAVLKAQQSGSSAVKGGRWSDPATWADKKAPAAGALVTINNGVDVVLDVTPPVLNGLTINGKLSFANNKDLELTTEWIMLHGELEIGTEKSPHSRKATITFTNNVKDEDISGVGGTTDRVDRGIMLMGGTLIGRSWTKLVFKRSTIFGSSSRWTPAPTAANPLMPTCSAPC